jgi:hypothetical protein
MAWWQVSPPATASGSMPKNEEGHARCMKTVVVAAAAMLTRHPQRAHPRHTRHVVVHRLPRALARRPPCMTPQALAHRRCARSPVQPTQARRLPCAHRPPRAPGLAAASLPATTAHHRGNQLAPRREESEVK